VHGLLVQGRPLLLAPQMPPDEESAKANHGYQGDGAYDAGDNVSGGYV